MTSVPYPIYLRGHPRGSNLSAVGRCRVCPELAEPELYQELVEKCVAQANVDVSSGEKECKKLHKKYMKESVAMATKLMGVHLGLDTSIVDVEVYLKDESHITKSQGNLACCFLDAGATKIVISGSALDAMQCCRLPRDRIVAHFDRPFCSAYSPADDFEISFVAAIRAVANASQFASTLSINFSSAKDDLKDTPTNTPITLDVEDIHMLSQLLSGEFTTSVPPQDNGIFVPHELDEEKQEKKLLLSQIHEDMTLVVQLSPADLKKDDQDIKELTQTLQAIIAKCGDGKQQRTDKTLVALVDPTPLELGMSFAACCKTDRTDGLFATVVCTRNNEALGLVYSSNTSIVAALESGRGVYYSRSRTGLWRKGDTSGHYQILHRIDVDCDGDALRFTVTQMGEDIKAFCHLDTLSCWRPTKGLRHLEETLTARLMDAPAGSYTKRLFDDEELLRNKLVEEAQELSEAQSKDDVAGELADVLYFAMVRAVKAGVSIDDAVKVLDNRAKKVTRRQGDSKAERIAAGDKILKSA